MIDRRSAAAHVFAEDLERPELDGDDRHHLARVLRLRTGEIVTVSDGSGRWRAFRVMDESVHLEPAGDVIQEDRPSPEIGVVFALIKGDRPELVVQKLTELGVDHIWPVISDRTVVRWDGSKADRHHERLRKVIREAAMQSRAVYVPHLHNVQPSLRDALVDIDAEGFGDVVALAEPDAPPLMADVSVLIVGPEGGFSPEELATAARRASLPGGILRAETAAITAGALLAENRRRRSSS